MNCKCTSTVVYVDTTHLLYGIFHVLICTYIHSQHCFPATFFRHMWRHFSNQNREKKIWRHQKNMPKSIKKMCTDSTHIIVVTFFSCIVTFFWCRGTFLIFWFSGDGPTPKIFVQPPKIWLFPFHKMSAYFFFRKMSSHPMSSYFGSKKWRHWMWRRKMTKKGKQAPNSGRKSEYIPSRIPTGINRKTDDEWVHVYLNVSG